MPEGNDSEIEYKYKWREVYQVAGIKVLEGKLNKNDALPRFSHTPGTKYFRKNSKGRIVQLRIYKGRNSFLDIDWGHGHGSIPRGTPHIQRWKYDAQTKTVIRLGTERPMSDYMWRKYGNAIMQADPSVKRKID